MSNTPEAVQPLVGNVTTQFVFGKPEDYAVCIEQNRLEQEAMVGYPLVVKGVRQTHTVNEHGHDVYEVFATYEPAPPGAETQAPPETPGAETQA